MDKKINSHYEINQDQAKRTDESSKLITELKLASTTKSERIKDIEDLGSMADRVNGFCDLLQKGSISHEEFTKLMEQTRKDKAKFEEAYMKDRIKHRLQDYQGMLSVFTEGSQAFMSTKVAIAHLKAML